MSWRERDYSQEQWGERVVLGIRVPPPGVLALIVVHAIAFVALFIAGRDIGPQVGGFSSLQSGDLHWTAILLYPLGITNFFTLLLLIITIIWTLGTRIEERFGFAAVLALYVVGNLLAGAAFFGLAIIRPGLAALPMAFPAGGVAAWIVFCIRELGAEELGFFGMTFPTRWFFAWVGGIGLAVVVLEGRLAALGWLLAAGAGAVTPLLSDFPREFHRLVWHRRRQSVRISVSRVREYSPPSPEPETIEQVSGPDAEIDAILAKISQSGLQSLTPQERETLEAARRALLRRS